MPEDTIIDRVKSLSESNRKLSIAFFLFLFYVAITLANISDIEFLSSSNKIKLPILNVELDFELFYLITPVLIVVFHFFLLLELKKHAQDFAKLGDNNKELPFQPFVFYHLKNEPPGVFKFLLVIAAISFIFLSVIVLELLQFHYAKTHDLTYNVAHLLIILLDLLLIILFFVSINKEKNLERKDKKNVRYLKIGVISIAVIFAIGAIGNTWKLYFIDDKREAYSYLGVFPMYLNLSDQVIQGGGVNFEENIQDSTLLSDNYSGYINLSNKDLRFAKFNRTILQNINLIKAQLSYVDFSYAVFSNCFLDDIDTIRNAKFKRAKMKNVSLYKTTFNGGVFFRSIFKRLHFKES